MECVSDVVVRKGAVCRNVRILVIIRGTDKDQVVGILTDGGNDGCCIRFERRPIACSIGISPRSFGFIVDFKNDVVVAAPFLGHCGKECLGIGCVTFRSMGMVVDDDVDIVVDRCLHNGVHQGLVFCLVCKVIAVAPVFVYAHRRADEFDVHIAYEAGDDLACPERRAHVGSDAPEKAHSLYLHFMA